ncbi:MAG: DEAD/DEAH box helicase [Defluviitaleaceae bacterium]|nr:DEAD/DEAH box helicase [Defluviitaleaceae bacterium]
MNQTNPNKQNFQEMNLSPEILRAIEDMGFEEATPIQSQCIAQIQAGKDVIGQSQTGTGKTAAFGIPLLERIDPDFPKVQALILCPTRELAIQISEEFNKLLRYRKGVRVLPIYGGQPIERQISALKKGVQVVVGTPGRIMDHMERRTLKLSEVSIAVLDEADEMLDMGFRDDIEFILEKLREDRQTLLFSATMPKSILDLTIRYQNNPKHITVIRNTLTVPSIEQLYFEVRESLKLEALCRLIDVESPTLSLVFCNTKKRVDELTEQLQGRGYFAESLHGDLKQMQRDSVMRKFRNRTLEILVATDVAARGIDVDDIDIVFNYDLPQDEEYYIHRIGRTGRAGREGQSFTFVAGREIYKLREIMRHTKAQIKRGKMPTLIDIEEIKTRQFTEKIKTIMEDGHLSKYANIVESLGDYSTMDIAAALFKFYLHDEDAEAEDVLFEEPRKFRNFDDDRGFYDKNDKNGKHSKNSKSGKNTKNMVRLFITIGKKDKVQPRDIVGTIANEANISGGLIGNIDIYEDFTFVDVPKNTVNKILSAISTTKIKNKKVKIEWAKPRR